MAATLKSLEKDGILTLSRNTTSGSPDSDVSLISLNDSERLQGRENFDFYCFLIWPFIEATWLGAVSLLMLTPLSTSTSAEDWLELKPVQDSAQLLGKTLYHQGDLSYFEAVNKETLKNAYTRFEDEGIIVVTKSRGSKDPPRVRLDATWMPQLDSQGKVEAEGRLWGFCERISQGRREGKNRRDGATVKTRVLGLIELMRAPLWEAGSVASVGVGAVDKKKGKRRRQARL